MMVAVIVAVIAALVLWIHHEPADSLPTAGRSCNIPAVDSLAIEIAGVTALGPVWEMRAAPEDAPYLTSGQFGGDEHTTGPTR